MISKNKLKPLASGCYVNNSFSDSLLGGANRLADLMIEHNVGVKPTKMYELKVLGEKRKPAGLYLGGPQLDGTLKIRPKRS